jgi:hypothetical protein
MEMCWNTNCNTLAHRRRSVKILICQVVVQPKPVQGIPTQWSTCKVVHQETNIQHRQKPSVGWCTRKVHNTIGGGLDGCIPIFSKILIRMVRFTVPRTDDKSMKDLLNSFTHFRFCAIADQLAHCSPFSDVIFQGVNEFLIRLESVYISNKRFASHKKLCSCIPQSTAGVSLKTVSVPTGSCCCFMLKAGNGNASAV